MGCPDIFPIGPFRLSCSFKNSPERVRDTIRAFPEKGGKPPGIGNAPVDLLSIEKFCGHWGFSDLKMSDVAFPWHSLGESTCRVVYGHSKKLITLEFPWSRSQIGLGKRGQT